MKNPFSPLVWRLLFATALVTVVLMTQARACDCVYPLAYAAPLQPQSDSWIFAPSRYSHDHQSGVRVAQYTAKPPIEPLPDQRAISSGYARTRTVLRGPDGNVSTYYQVKNYGNDRGGMDAEWERFHDAWRGSTVAGGSFAGGGFGVQPYGFGGFQGGGFPGGGFTGGGFPGGGYPGGGYQGGYGPGRDFGPGRFPGTPDPRLLDPDGADGFYGPDRRRTPDRRFFGPNYRVPGEKRHHKGEHEGGKEK